MRSFPVSLDEIEEHLNAIDGSGALELEHVIAMKRYDFISQLQWNLLIRTLENVDACIIQDT